MTYLVNHNRAKARKVQMSVTIVGVFVVVIAVVVVVFPHFIPSLFASAVAPFWRAQYSVQSGSLRSPNSLLAENEELKRQLSELKVDSVNVAAVMDENEELKRAMGRGTSTPKVLAAVLLRPPLSHYDELVIDVSEKEKVGQGDKVFAEGNILIGEVVKMMGGVSLVKLFSSPGEKYEVMIGKNHNPATAVGRGGGQYEAELPRVTNVSEGDIVTAPSINVESLGIVSGIVSDPVNPFQKVIFAPPVNIYNLKWVYVAPKK